MYVWKQRFVEIQYTEKKDKTFYRLCVSPCEILC